MEAVLKSKDEQTAFLKEHYEEMKQDADYTVVLACMIINTNSQNEYKLSEQQQHEVDENYYYLKYRLNESGENARQFNKNIQIANTLYLSTLFLTMNGLFSEEYKKTDFNAFCDSLHSSYRLMNHTDNQLWTLPQIIQATMMNINNMMFQNYSFITESITNCGNVYTAERLYESKELLHSYQTLLVSGLYSAFEIIHYGPEKFAQLDQKTEKPHFFESVCGPLAGKNFQSYSYVYNDQLIDITDLSLAYFVNFSENVEPLKLPAPIADHRKKCCKACMAYKIPRDKLFEFVIDAPKFGTQKDFATAELRSLRELSILVNAALRYAFLNVMGTPSEEVAQFIENFAQSMSGELPAQLVRVVKGESVQAEALPKKSAYDYYVTFAVLGAVLIALGKTDEYKQLQKHYFE